MTVKDTKATTTKKPPVSKAKVEPDVEKEQMKSEIEQLKAMVAQMLNAQQTQPQQVIQAIQPQYQDEQIRSDKYVKVMSLRKGLLSLTTEQNGNGKAFRFKKFGEIKTIMYQDLLLLIHNQQRFAEEGYFYIFDDAVVNSAGLREFYDNILTKELIENLLEHDKEVAVDMFERAPQGQREMVVAVIIEKMLEDNSSIPYDKLDAFSRIYDRNIYQLVEEIKESKQINETEKG